MPLGHPPDDRACYKIMFAREGAAVLGREGAAACYWAKRFVPPVLMRRYCCRGAGGAPVEVEPPHGVLRGRGLGNRRDRCGDADGEGHTVFVGGLYAFSHIALNAA